MIRTTLLILALANPAAAQTADSLLICPATGELAQTIMTNRQNGVSMSTHVANILPKDETARALIMGIITAAYDVPRFSAPDNQRRAIEDFRNEMEVVCFRAMNPRN